MARLLSIEIECRDCNETYGILVDYEKRNDVHDCYLCDGEADRVWSVPNVSTEKTSASIPDGCTGGRFDPLKIGQEGRKMVSAAKKAYAANPNDANAKEVKKARKENEKIKRGGK